MERKEASRGTAVKRSVVSPGRAWWGLLAHLCGVPQGTTKEADVTSRESISSPCRRVGNMTAVVENCSSKRGS